MANIYSEVANIWPDVKINSAEVTEAQQMAGEQFETETLCLWSETRFLCFVLYSSKSYISKTISWIDPTTSKLTCDSRDLHIYEHKATEGRLNAEIDPICPFVCTIL